MRVHPYFDTPGEMEFYRISPSSDEGKTVHLRDRPGPPKRSAFSSGSHATVGVFGEGLKKDVSQEVHQTLLERLQVFEPSSARPEVSVQLSEVEPGGLPRLLAPPIARLTHRCQKVCY